MSKLTNELLTIEDFKLLQQSREPESREAIAKKIGFHFDSTQKESVEYKVACEIAFYLQKDDEVPVRIALAQSVQESQNAPKQLVLLLAMDEQDAVAIPLLQYSPVITKYDLISILPKVVKQNRLLAVAQRNYLSVTVCSLLADRSFEEIVMALLNNDSAVIDDEVILQIAYKYSRSSKVLKNLLHRVPMPTRAVEHMVRIQQEKTKNKSAVEQVQSFSLIEKDELKNDLLTLMFLGGNPSQETCEHMISQLEKKNKVTATFMLLSMCLGQDRFFNSYIAHNTGLPVERVKPLCNTGEQEFSMLMNKSGISPSLYPLMFHTYQAMVAALDNSMIAGSKEFSTAMIHCLSEAEAKGVNFATTLGRPLAKALRETI